MGGVDKLMMIADVVDQLHVKTEADRVGEDVVFEDGSGPVVGEDSVLGHAVLSRVKRVVVNLHVVGVAVHADADVDVPGDVAVDEEVGRVVVQTNAVAAISAGDAVMDFVVSDDGAPAIGCDRASSGTK